MDIDFLNDIKKHSNTLNNHEPIKEVQKCPKCSSYLIEEDECGVCHYQMNYDLLGEPLGPKSFYSLRENYLNGLSLLEKENLKLFRNETSHKSFINKVKFRYNDLLDFFYSTKSVNHEYRSVFLHELRDVVIELMDSGVCEDEIWKPLNEMNRGFDLHTHSLFERIREVTLEHRTLKKQRSSSLLSYKFANMISISNLLMTLLFALLLVSISLAFISYKSVIS